MFSWKFSEMFQNSYLDNSFDGLLHPIIHVQNISAAEKHSVKLKKYDKISV